jgi:hypothetical protein
MCVNVIALNFMPGKIVKTDLLALIVCAENAIQQIENTERIASILSHISNLLGM